MVKHIGNIKIFLILTGLLFFFSCNIISYEKKDFEDSYKLNLMKNGNFIEYLQYGNLKDTFYGRWEKGKNMIKLVIETPETYTYTDTNAVVAEFDTLTNDSLFFKVNKYARIYMNNNFIDSNPTDTNGMLRIKRTVIEKFTVCTFDGNVSYVIENRSSNYFIIQTDKKIPANISVLRLNPTIKYLKKANKLIPVMYDSIRPEFALRRKYIPLSIPP